MEDPRGAEGKASKRKCKLSVCQSPILSVSGAWLAPLTAGKGQGALLPALPWFLPSHCTQAFLPALKDKGHFRAELYNLFGRAIFSRDCSLIHFPVQSHEEPSCHIYESRMAG